MRFFAVALIFFGVAASYAQAPVVPHKMHFADMTLTIRDEARREIQKDVDGLVRNPKYFDLKVERAKRYFPIIAKIFSEENIPDDLKYLVLQESSLVADAVSTSNAVGFWQFKDFTAISVGLRVDKQIDERMNIFSASRGAAKYLKQNNQQFDNWIIALQAYQMGAGGVKRSVGDKHNGKRHFEVTADTYWYIKKFIAHKVAFENVVSGPPQIFASVVELNEKKSFRELAKDVNVDEAVLREYNRWALADAVPGDKSYFVVVPSGTMGSPNSVSVLDSKRASKAKPIAPKKLPLSREIKLVNGLRAIQAAQSESLVTLADQAGIALTRFLKFNEMSIDQPIESGSFYFLEKKKTSATTTEHKVKVGDDLWSISQKYGVQLKRIKKWNKAYTTGRLLVGSTIWLSANPTPGQPVPIMPEVPKDQIALLEQESFNWEVKAHDSPRLDSTRSEVVQLIEVPVMANTGANQAVTEHFVAKGETLYSIAKVYGVSVLEVAKWNDLSVNTSIPIGQRIVLYVSKEVEKLHEPESAMANLNAEIPLMHLVTQSDTLYAIARQYGVTIKDLMEWNDKKELGVKEGEKIKIRKK